MFIAIATLVGTVIGAGILGIPYIVSQAGFLTGLLVIVVIAIAALVVNLYLGEVILRTKGNHQLPGYARKYLGRWGKRFMALSMVFGVYGAMIAYTIGQGPVIKEILGTPAIANSLVFFAIGISLLYLGLKSIGKSELIITGLLIAVLILFSVLMFPLVKLSNLSQFSLTRILIPYGVVLFAFIGTAAIPEMKSILIKKKKQLKQAIIIGSLIPLAIYILFTAAVIGAIGSQGFLGLESGQRIATVAISMNFGRSLGIVANLFAFFAMGTSFIALGLALRDMYHFDFGLNKKLSFGAVVIIPFIVFMLDTFVIDVTNFMSALGIAGSVAGGIAGTLIVMMYWKAKSIGERKPEYNLTSSKIIGYLLICMFILGIIYAVISFF